MSTLKRDLMISSADSARRWEIWEASVDCNPTESREARQPFHQDAAGVDAACRVLQLLGEAPCARTEVLQNQLRCGLNGVFDCFAGEASSGDKNNSLQIQFALSSRPSRRQELMHQCFWIIKHFRCGLFLLTCGLLVHPLTADDRGLPKQFILKHDHSTSQRSLHPLQAWF